MSNPDYLILKPNVDDFLLDDHEIFFHDMNKQKMWSMNTEKEWAPYFSTKFLDIIANIAPIRMVMVFSKPPGWDFNLAHIDPGEVFAMNLVLNKGTETHMNWFDFPKDPAILNHPSSKKTTQVGTSYFEWSTNHMNHRTAACLDNKLSVVRVNIPHMITTGDRNRVCISVRLNLDFLKLSLQSKDGDANWDKAFNFFKSFADH